MKKYLKEIELSGMLMMLIGVLLNLTGRSSWAVWTIVIAIALWLVTVIYKAMRWSEYKHDNQQNIIIMLATIVVLFIIMLYAR
jgi:hypothetical protein